MNSTHNKKRSQESPVPVSVELIKPQPDATLPHDPRQEPTDPVPMVVDNDSTSPATPGPESSVQVSDDEIEFGVSIHEMEEEKDNSYMVVDVSDSNPPLPPTIITPIDIIVPPTHLEILNDNNPTILPNQTIEPTPESTPSTKPNRSLSYETLSKIVETTIILNPTLKLNPESNPKPTHESSNTYSIDPHARIHANLEKELNEWCEENNLPINCFDVLKENQIQNINQLNNIKDHILERIASQLKAIPAKKFRAAIMKLKQNPLQSKYILFGEDPKPQPVQSRQKPSSPSPCYPSIPEPTSIQNDNGDSVIPYDDPYSSGRNLEEIQALNLHMYGNNLNDPDSKTEYPKAFMRELPDEPEIGASVIKTIELGLSIELLKEEIKKEGEILEHVIDLVTNKSDQFTPKALEVLNQSKLEHQERAKRLKKIILDKKTKEEPVVPSAIPEESVAVKREPAICDPLLSSNSPIIRPPPLTFQPTVESYEIHDGQSYDQTKRYGQEKPILLVVKASLTMEKDEMLARRLQEQERIQDIESRKKKVDNCWTCTYCSRDNGHNLKCSDCFNEYRYALKVTPAQWQNKDYCLRCRYRIHPSDAPICSTCKSAYNGLLRVFVMVKNSRPIPHQQVSHSFETGRQQQSHQGEQRVNHSTSSLKSEYVAGYRCQDCLTAAVMLNTPCRTCSGRKYEPVYVKEEVQVQPIRDAGSWNGVGSGGGGFLNLVGGLFMPSSSSSRYDVKQGQSYAETAKAFSSQKALGGTFAHDYNTY